MKSEGSVNDSNFRMLEWIRQPDEYTMMHKRDGHIDPARTRIRR